MTPPSSVFFFLNIYTVLTRDNKLSGVMSPPIFKFFTEEKEGMSIPVHSCMRNHINFAVSSLCYTRKKKNVYICDIGLYHRFKL